MIVRLAALSAALAALGQATPEPLSQAAQASILAAAATGPVVRIDAGTKYQVFDGMGISEAFQRSRVVHGADGLTPKHQNLVLDLLFSNTTGAGLTILRNGIGSSANQPWDLMESIAPNPPASNSSDLDFVPLSSLRGDQQQIWLSKQFLARGGRLIYADSWSADYYMKTNGNDRWGGLLCGVTNTSCPTGDWRQAYANKLARYIQDYQRAGIKIDYVNFLNEPDLNTSYASMQSDGQQAADFINVLAPTLRRAGITTEIACCDGSGWEQNRARLTGIQAAGAEHELGLVTAHGYSSRPSTPFNTTKKVWMSEWSGFDPWNPSWYNSGVSSEGLTWANRIQSAFGNSNVSAFIFWWGAANDTDNQALIHTPGNNVYVSKRLWAHAHYGRLVHPGAYRIDASIINRNDSILNATSFSNPDGSVAVQVINNGDSDQLVTLRGAMSTQSASVVTWLTNQNNNFTQNVPTMIDRGNIISRVPARSLLSFFVSATKRQ